MTILRYDLAWTGNSNLQNATTIADVGKVSEENGNLRVQLVNIHDAANNENDYQRINEGEIVYLQDSGTTFQYLNVDRVIYLAAPKAADGNLLIDSNHGFIIGEQVTQLVNNKIITANVKSYSNNPPFVVVSGANGDFIKNVLLETTISNIKVNVVGDLSPLEDESPYLGNYIIEEPALYYSNCANDIFFDCENLGDYLGPHIGIDKHFTGFRGQDYTNTNIIVSNWDITGNNVPIGQVLDLYENVNKEYVSIGMNVTATDIINSESKLLHLETKGNTTANVIVYANTTTTNVGKVVIFQNNSNTFFTLTENAASFNTRVNQINSTLHTKSYADGVAYYHSANGYVSIDVTNAFMHIVTSSTNTVNSLAFIKPSENLKRAYSVAVSFKGINTISNNCWTGANVHWPGGVPPSYSTAVPTILSFLNTHDPSNSAFNNTWYGFNPYNAVSGEVTAQVNDENITCIFLVNKDVITEPSYITSVIVQEDEYLRYRARYPNRKTYILTQNTFPLVFGGGVTPNSASNTASTNVIPTLSNTGFTLASSWGSSPNDFGPIEINADYDNCSNTSDWFTLCNLENLPSGSPVWFFYRDFDIAYGPDGMELRNDDESLRFRGSFKLFRQQCCNNNITIYHTSSTNQVVSLPFGFYPAHRQLIPFSTTGLSRKIDPCQVLNGVPPGCPI